MFDTLKKFLVEEIHVNADKVTMEAELLGDLEINSIDIADLVMFCENEFNVVIGDEDLHNFNTVGDIVHFIESAQN